MSIDSIVTLLIGLGAAIYIGSKVRRSVVNLLSPGASACGGGCSGCGPSSPNSSDENSPPRETLIQLKKRSSPN